MTELPARIWKPPLATYLCGAAFLVRSESILLGQSQAAKTADIDHAFRQIPLSTEQILHPDRYWDLENVDEPQVMAIGIGELPTGWSVIREDTLGELMLAILCTAPADRGGINDSDATAVFKVPFTNAQADGWDGDRLVLVSNGPSHFLVLASRWDSERDAQEFHDALTGLRKSLSDSARAMTDHPSLESGVDIHYGAVLTDVVLSVYSGVDQRDLTTLRRVVKCDN